MATIVELSPVFVPATEPKISSEQPEGKDSIVKDLKTQETPKTSSSHSSSSSNNKEEKEELNRLEALEKEKEQMKKQISELQEKLKNFQEKPGFDLRQSFDQVKSVNLEVNSPLSPEKAEKRRSKIEGFYRKMLKKNKIWSEKVRRESPEFFDHLTHIQRPKVLWIGCADSRLPPTDITGTQPGDIFVQRNVANLVIHTDMNLMSVLQYGVEQLQVEHIIVCGHYNCGGIHHAMSNKYLGLIDKWCRHIKEVYRLNRAELDAIADPVQRERRLVELNVIEQVYHLCTTTIIQKTWKKNGVSWQDKGQNWIVPTIHGWVYDVADGLIKELPIDYSKIDDIFRFDFDDK